MKKKKGKYPRFSGGDDTKTKPDLRPDRPGQSTHAHDDFEIIVEGEHEPTATDTPLYTGESGANDELTDPSEDEVQTKQTDISEMDLELPRSSLEEVLPVYRSSRESHKPVPKQEIPPPAKPAFPKTPLPSSDKQDILELFDDPENASLSVELTPPKDFKSPKPATPVREPDKFEIINPGGITGVRPLDGDQFGSRPIPRKKRDQRILGPVAPLPMAYSEQVVSRRFRISLRDVILVVLILILAAALVLGWFIYQDYRERQNLKALAQESSLIEKEKDEAIQGKARKTDGEIPYKGNIEKPQGGKK